MPRQLAPVDKGMTAVVGQTSTCIHLTIFPYGV
jgi:hypothetical protein